MEAKLFNCYLANNLIWRLAKTFLGMLPLYSQWQQCQGVSCFNTIAVLSLGQGDLYLYSLSRFVIMVLSIYFSHSGHGGWIDCQCWQEKGSIFLWQCLGQQIRRSPFWKSDEMYFPRETTIQMWICRKAKKCKLKTDHEGRLYIVGFVHVEQSCHWV